jgi:predicted nucleic acid-binding protein
MTVLDTNVLSELMAPVPSAVVLARLKRFPLQQLFITSITAAEIRLGVGSLPAGKRRETLSAKMLILLDQTFADRILPFDGASAQRYADVVLGRRLAGRPISIADAQIAAIARGHGAPLMTRNIRDFEHCDLSLINPWEEELPA